MYLGSQIVKGKGALVEGTLLAWSDLETEYECTDLETTIHLFPVMILRDPQPPATGYSDFVILRAWIEAEGKLVTGEITADLKLMISPDGLSWEVITDAGGSQCDAGYDSVNYEWNCAFTRDAHLDGAGLTANTIYIALRMILSGAGQYNLKNLKVVCRVFYFDGMTVI